MHRRPNLLVKALGISLVLWFFGTSCERELGDSIDPVPSWRKHFLQDGDRGVDIRSILYVELHVALNPDSANSNTVKLFQASGSPLLASAIFTGEGAEVPGTIAVFNLESGKGAYLSFDPLCDLYTLTDYRLELIGLLQADGTPVPDLILHFTTGHLPPDYLDPFYCDELVLPLQAYDLDDFFGINDGLAADPVWNAVAHLVAVGVTDDPPTYERVLDPVYYFGYSDADVYTPSDNLLASPPYKVLVYINNRSGADLDLGLTPGWFNVQPYWPRSLVDSFDTVDAWTSSDPGNTPVSLEEEEYFEGFSAMRIGLDGINSLDDAVSRDWSGGFPAEATGIMFAWKMGNVTSGGASFSGLQLQLTDSDGNVIGTDMEIAGANTNWVFFTRTLPGDFVSLVGATFDQTQVNKISLVQVFNVRGNDLVGDLFVDFLTLGDLKDVPVYYPLELVTPWDTLPLYVDEDGSTYWAYNNNGVHILSLDASGCYSNCPLLDPSAALTSSNLAQAAP